MANRLLIVSCFNKKFEEFLTDLIIVFPEDQDFRMFKNSFQLLKNIDERKCISMFSQYAATYRVPILSKDEGFFFNQSFNELVPIAGNNISILVDKLKNMWSELDSTNRDTVWKYLTAFILLQDKYIATTGI
jgi:hypothetical protein